jgi:hypothetical protein
VKLSKAQYLAVSTAQRDEQGVLRVDASLRLATRRVLEREGLLRENSSALTDEGVALHAQAVLAAQDDQEAAREVRMDHLHALALEEYQTARDTARETAAGLSTAEIGRLLDARWHSGWAVPGRNRAVLLDELHARALAECPTGRDEVRENVARLSTGDLGTMLDAGQHSGWERAVLLGELHARALAEYPRIRDYTRLTMRVLSSTTLGQLLDDWTSGWTVDGWNVACARDELHARARIGYISFSGRDEVRGLYRDMESDIKVSHLLDTQITEGAWDGYRLACLRDELHTRALRIHNTVYKVRHTMRSKYRGVGTRTLSRDLAGLMLVPGFSGYRMACLRDELHTRALAEHDDLYPGRDKVRRSMAVMTTEHLGHRVDTGDMDGYRLACARDELHARALMDDLVHRAVATNDGIRMLGMILDEATPETLQYLGVSRESLMDNIHTMALHARALTGEFKDAGPLTTFRKDPARLTPRSLELFLAYAKDAGNWAGTPMIGGNLGGSKEDRGNITQLKKMGLVTTFSDRRGDAFITFTPAGVALAAEHGIPIH